MDICGALGGKVPPVSTPPSAFKIRVPPEVL